MPPMSGPPPPSGGQQDDGPLYAAAAAARARAYAPHSAFAVGAALRTADGALHAGCNVENASFPEGWCAETSALAAMVLAAPPGEGRVIVAAAIVAERVGGRLVTPCGGCRQRLAEFGTVDTLVHVADPAGAGATYRLGDLLPEAFALDVPERAGER